MRQMELCRICLAYGDGDIRMYPVTRYQEIIELFTQAKLDMNDVLPHSVCYSCNAMLKKLCVFVKQINDTEIYYKEILRNTAKPTLESFEKFKTEMILKMNNLSHDENNEVENERTQEAESEKIKELESHQQKSSSPDQESKSPHRVLKKSSDHSQETSLDNEDDLLSIEEENMTLMWSPKIENEAPNIPNMEINDEPSIETNSFKQSNHKPESSVSNNLTTTPDPLDSFLLRAKNYRPSEKNIKSSNANANEDAVTTNPVKNHCPYPKCIEERIEIEKEPQRKKLTFEGVGKRKGETISKLHNLTHLEMKESDTEEYNLKSPQLISKLPDQESESPHRTQKELSEHSQHGSLENEDEILSNDEIRLEWSPDSENEPPNILNVEIGDQRIIENNKSCEQSNRKGNHVSDVKTSNNKVTEEVKKAEINKIEEEAEDIKKIDTNDEDPHTLCSPCYAVLYKLEREIVKSIISSEIFPKKARRNTYKLLQTIKKLKRRMISKHHNLSHEKIKDTESKENNMMETELIKKAESYEINDFKSPQQKLKLTDQESETELIKKAESDEIMDLESPQQKSKLTDKGAKSPHREQKQSSEHIQEKSIENEHKILSTEEEIKLTWSPDSENDESPSPNIPNMEIGVWNMELLIENNNSSEQSNGQSESNFNKRTKTPDPTDTFLLCAKKYRPTEQIFENNIPVNQTEPEETPRQMKIDQDDDILEDSNIEVKIESLDEELLEFSEENQGKSPSELFYRRQFRDKLPSVLDIEFADCDLETKDKDTEMKAKGKDYADRKRGATESDIGVGDKVYVKKFVKENKLSAPYNDVSHTVVSKKGNDVEVENDSTGQRLRRNIVHLKRVEGQWEVCADKDDQSNDNEMVSVVI